LHKANKPLIFVRVCYIRVWDIKLGTILQNWTSTNSTDEWFFFRVSLRQLEGLSVWVMAGLRWRKWKKILCQWFKPVVNFTNSLWGAFTNEDPIIAKNTVKPSVFFALSGSVCVKATCKILVKLTPGVVFTNGLWDALEQPDPKRAKRHWWRDCLFVILGFSHVKALHKHVDEINPWAI